MAAPAHVATEVSDHSHKWLIAIAVMVGTILEVLDTSIVNVALPHMQGSFSASVDEITWVVTSYLVANGVMIPMTGWIASRFGRKRYFLISVLFFVAASAVCGAAQTLDQMVLFRLIQGIAGAAMIPCSQAILMETFPPEEQALAMATWGVGMMAAPIMGPTLGGWITDNWSWRWNFYINIPTGLAAFLMVSAFVHDPVYLRRDRRTGGKVDYIGIALLIVGLGLLQVVLDRGERSDWFASAWVIYTTIIAAAAIIGLVIRELRFSDPILDLRMFKSRDFTLSVFLILLMVLAVFANLLLNPVFLQEYMGYSASKAGVAMAPRALGSLFSMFLIGQLARRRFDTRPLIALGFCLMGFGMWEMSKWTLDVSMWAVCWPTVPFGMGSGLIFPTLSAKSLASVARERMGYASSLFNMMRNTGSALGISIVINLLTRREQIHQAYLVQHFSVFESWKLAQLAPRVPGAPTFRAMGQSGGGQSLAEVYHLIQAQAAILSFNDIYRMLAMLVVVLVPVTFLLGKAQGQAGAAH
ncbi:MAG TPA: DHA2 family efflux MFS transporter permease subunit [Candidatus Binataceae bacterium]|nr:DHA2 family efflux MFS transporter permease subunit [Candidatus Binataceae bacterium]